MAPAQRPLGKSLQPTEALQAHKSPEKAQAARDPEVTLPPPLPLLSFLLSISTSLLCSQQYQGQKGFVSQYKHLHLNASFFFFFSCKKLIVLRLDIVYISSSSHPTHTTSTAAPQCFYTEVRVEITMVDT